MRGFGIDDHLVQVIQTRGCLLSPFLINLFVDKIMQETMQDYCTSISIGGRPLCNLRLTDDIVLIGGNNSELKDLTTRLVDKAKDYGMATNDIPAIININAY